jgi:glycosyltransferase involved in cell wall biosynthesis
VRIAMITGEYPPMEGGVGAYTQQLALALTGGGHQVHILTTSPVDGSPSRAEEQGVTVDRTVWRWDLGGIAQARRWLRHLRPDVVVLQYEPAAYGMLGAITFAPALLRRRAQLPLVVSFHDLLPPYLFPKAGALRQHRVWELARHADGVIVTNHDDLDRLTQTLGEAAPPTRLIPIGSNISAAPPVDYQRDLWRAEWGFASSDLVVGFFGFLNRSKGIEVLLASLSELITQGLPAHLLFIGGRTGTSDVTNASYAEEVDAMIASLGLSDRVQWTGFAEPEDVSAALLGIDVCVLPYREGANLRHGTLHAALAHGCAIVTTRAATPAPYLTHSDHLLLVPPDDPHALTDAIANLAADPAQCRRLGAAAKSLAAEFVWPRIAAESADFLESLRRDRAEPPPRAVVE